MPKWILSEHIKQLQQSIIQAKNKLSIRFLALPRLMMTPIRRRLLWLCPDTVVAEWKLTPDGESCAIVSARRPVLDNNCRSLNRKPLDLLWPPDSASIFEILNLKRDSNELLLYRKDTLAYCSPFDLCYNLASIDQTGRCHEATVSSPVAVHKRRPRVSLTNKSFGAGAVEFKREEINFD
jgi:hypothetical protein